MEAHSNLLESMTEQQQAQVFELMAIGNIEDVNVAAKLFIDSGYDMNRAVQRWLDGNIGGVEEHNIPTTREPLMTAPPVNRGNQAEIPRNNETDAHIQYKRYIQRKAREEEEKGITDTIKKGAGSLIYGFKSVWNFFVPVAIRGETAGGEQFIMHFWRNYTDLYSTMKFNNGNFEDNAWYANQAKKPLLVYVHVDGEGFRAIPNNLFRNKNLTDLMNNKFQLLGILLNTEESQKIIKYVETRHCPCLAVFRTNLLDETVLVEFISLTNESTPEQVLERLKGVERNFYMIEIEENRIKQEVRRSLDDDRRRNMQMNAPLFYANNFNAQNDEYEGGQMFPFFNGGGQQQQRRPQANPEEQQRLEEARTLRQIQDEEFKEVERKIKEQQQKQAEDERSRKEKEEQEALTKRQKEEDERRKAEQKELTKQLKLGNIPAEPAEDAPDAVLIIIRLPDGNRTERRFRASDKVGVLYDYVDTQDVQFDSSTVRYDLMQPRPFLCLEDKEKTIGEYFEGSNSEVILVRELTD